MEMASERVNMTKTRLPQNNHGKITIMENKGVPVSTLENNPERSEYKLMCQVLGLYLEEPCNLQNYKEKEDYLYTFAKVFPQV